MGNINEKTKKIGIKVVYNKVMNAINKISFNLCKLLPFKKNTIIFESEGDLSDNAYALYEFMVNNGYMEKYKAIWLVDNVSKYKSYENPNLIITSKVFGKLRLKTSYYLATSGYYIFDHNLLTASYKKRKGQRVVYLTHGAGFKSNKSTKNSCNRTYNNSIDDMFATGDIAGEIISEFLDYNLEGIKFLGYPRNDYFFSILSETKNTLNMVYGFFNYKNIILWMPTFRQSRVNELSEDYLVNETGLPVIRSRQELFEINEYLRSRNSLMVLKVHQLSANLPVYDTKLSNILILHNEDLQKNNIQLYQFVACTDMLVTDYSSISTDYLLLDKPIIYTLDDYEQYASSRGIYPDNAIDYMPGHHVYSFSELINALEDIFTGNDLYYEKRKKIKQQFHVYCDGNSSKRIVEYLKL